jgi:hypothetical protein
MGINSLPGKLMDAMKSLEVNGRYEKQTIAMGVIDFHGKSMVAMDSQCLLYMSLVAMGSHW